MKTKILIAILTISVFSISTMKAQEKIIKMKQDTMKMDHSKMEMEHDSTEMKMDHSKMEMEHDSTEMKMDHSKMEMMNMKMDHSKMTKTFVCPMHPEVTMDKPEKCPKCGMDMVEKKMEMKKEDTPKKHKH